MNFAKEARKLANFIKDLDSFQTYAVSDSFCYNHIGALYTDVVLQAGLNYNSVVKPRVQKILITYPEADTVQLFKELIKREGIKKVLTWNHPTKLERMARFIAFSEENDINTCMDFKNYLLNSHNQQRILEINGFGPKTLDYLLKLLNFDTVAVDRHIYSFVELAEVPINGYYPTKKVVEYAADLLEMPRAAIDYSIWKYMSGQDTKDNAQLTLSF